MSNRVASGLLTAIMWLLVVAGAVLFLEAARRVIDGYAILSLPLVKLKQHVDLTQAGKFSQEALAKRLTFSRDVDAAWFLNRPAPIPEKSTPDVFRRRHDAHPHTSYMNNWVWNAKTLENPGFIASFRLETAFEPDLFIFEPGWGTPHPYYRQPANVTTTDGLTLNQWGWRGPDIAPQPGQDAIRVVCLGDSTTAENKDIKVTYPEALQHWLNIWAASRGLGVRFEVMNTARQTIHSQDIAAIFVNEALPFQPDYAVFYGLANQFNVGSVVPNVSIGANPSRPPAGHGYSALISRWRAVLHACQSFWQPDSGRPKAVIRFPQNIDEHDPALDEVKDTLNLGQILSDLDAMKQVADERGVTFFMTSFRWFAYPGMEADPSVHSGITSYYNMYYWPLSYADIHRLASFQNRVYAKWARQRQTGFIDIDADMPWLADLYRDPVHSTQEGVYARAWITMQRMLPRIRADLAEGRLPRNRRVDAEASFVFPEAKLAPAPKIEDIARNLPRALPGLDVNAFTPADSQSRVAAGEVVSIDSGDNPSGYMAMMKIPDQAAALKEQVWLHLRVHVRMGRVALGVLDKTRQRMICYQIASQDGDWRSFLLKLDGLAEAGYIVVSNAQTSAGQRSSIDVSHVEFLRNAK